MCGIIYVRKRDGTRANKAVLKRFERQRERGTQGFGYVAIGTTALVRRAEWERDIRDKLAAEEASEILFHHRYPTSTGNYLDATHPMRVSNPALDYTYLVVHNGIIENADDLKQDHEARGFAYRTIVTHTTATRNYQYTHTEFNDSEALAIDPALALEGKQERMAAKGSIAFVALQLARMSQEPLALLYGRNHGAPLYLETQEQFTALSSQGGGMPIDVHTLYRHEYAKGQTREEAMAIGEYPTRSYALSTFDGWGERGLSEQIAELEATRRELIVMEKLARQDRNEESLDEIASQLALINEDIAELRAELAFPLSF